MRLKQRSILALMKTKIHELESSDNDDDFTTNLISEIKIPLAVYFLTNSADLSQSSLLDHVVKSLKGTTPIRIGLRRSSPLQLYATNPCMSSKDLFWVRANFDCRNNHSSENDENDEDSLLFYFFSFNPVINREGFDLINSVEPRPTNYSFHKHFLHFLAHNPAINEETIRLAAEITSASVVSTSLISIDSPLQALLSRRDESVLQYIGLLKSLDLFKTPDFSALQEYIRWYNLEPTFLGDNFSELQSNTDPWPFDPFFEYLHYSRHVSSSGLRALHKLAAGHKKLDHEHIFTFMKSKYFHPTRGERAWNTLLSLVQPSDMFLYWYLSLDPFSSFWSAFSQQAIVSQTFESHFEVQSLFVLCMRALNELSLDAEESIPELVPLEVAEKFRDPCNYTHTGLYVDKYHGQAVSDAIVSELPESWRACLKDEIKKKGLGYSLYNSFWFPRQEVYPGYYFSSSCILSFATAGYFEGAELEDRDRWTLETQRSAFNSLYTLGCDVNDVDDETWMGYDIDEGGSLGSDEEFSDLDEEDEGIKLSSEYSSSEEDYDSYHVITSSSSRVKESDNNNDDVEDMREFPKYEFAHNWCTPMLAITWNPYLDDENSIVCCKLLLSRGASIVSPESGYFSGTHIDHLRAQIARGPRPKPKLGQFIEEQFQVQSLKRLQIQEQSTKEEQTNDQVTNNHNNIQKVEAKSISEEGPAVTTTTTTTNPNPNSNPNPTSNLNNNNRSSTSSSGKDCNIS